ncbi:hypothetical protein [Sediminibacillus massiliensis]|uniref:hypothetical protein n=1 Tax=Sediminibacillus massiliensis TaxID=1926277 RepID=UPI0009888607|nr:hypothetical protein [Sediminibacillus massiliensis]
MKVRVSEKEIFYLILKTCFCHNIHMAPGMTLIDMWRRLAAEMDSFSRKIWIERLTEQVNLNNNRKLKEMLLILESNQDKEEDGKEKIS